MEAGLLDVEIDFNMIALLFSTCSVEYLGWCADFELQTGDMTACFAVDPGARAPEGPPDRGRKHGVDPCVWRVFRRLRGKERVWGTSMLSTAKEMP